MKTIAIVGAGITGLSAGQMLREKCRATVFEQHSKVGGLIKCDRVRDNLFHRVGGHVFNSRRQDVLTWFWSFFDCEREFVKAKRNAKILLRGKTVGYPLENHLWQLDRPTVEAVLRDLMAIHAHAESDGHDYSHFEDFLTGTFGNTLYELYFAPYNRKLWNTDLRQVPLEWLDGKLPMPDLHQILASNILKQEEAEMVHSTFFYAKEGGSQFIVDRLAKGLDIRTSCPVVTLHKTSNAWLVNGEAFDNVIFTGDVRTLHRVLQDADGLIAEASEDVMTLTSNGTSNLFCETDTTDISWLYLPDADILPHRIIYTGTFAPSNNRGSERMTCVVEFSGYVSWETMEKESNRLPGNLAPLDSNYEPNSYVVQQPGTRASIERLKQLLSSQSFYLAGRFAEWEYHNMDKAIEAAMAIANQICPQQQRG